MRKIITGILITILCLVAFMSSGCIDMVDDSNDLSDSSQIPTPIITPNPEPIPDLCRGITCNDKCIGNYLYYDGYCLNGQCKYSSTYCQYGCSRNACNINPCKGIICSDYCDGDWSYTQGICVYGSCQYSFTEYCQYGCANGKCISKPTSPIPDDYYNRRCEIPAEQNVIEWLLADWNENNQYQAKQWDCSNMAIYTEYILENCGYDAVIQGDNNHAWLLIWLPAGVTTRNEYYELQYTTTNGYYLFEVTGCYFPSNSEYYKYNALYQWDDIYEVWDWCIIYYDEETFYREYGWNY